MDNLLLLKLRSIFIRAYFTENSCRNYEDFKEYSRKINSLFMLSNMYLQSI
jgi:hypothetical protein